MKTFWLALLAAASGGVAAYVVWQYADRSLKAQLTSGGDLLAQSLAQGSTQLTAQAQQARVRAQQAVSEVLMTKVIPQVRAEVTRDLTTAGITPQLIAEAKKVLVLARSAGVIS